MKIIRIEHDGSGGSRTSDIEVDLQEQPFAANVPPLLVSQPRPAQDVRLVEFPTDVRDTEPHPTPRRQYAVILSGVAETETTDGEVRRFGPGALVLLEDAEGRGHVTRVVDAPFRVLFVALASADGKRQDV